MASIGMHTAKNLSRKPSFLPITKPNPISPTNSVSRTNKIPQISISASIAPSHQTILSTQNHEQLMDPASDPQIRSGDHLGKVDSWVEDSVSDIVKNLKQAPLLVQIYSEFDGKIRIQTEKAVSEEWSVARDEWRSGESRSPDGLIFVEELERESGENENQGVTRAWGIVVQGKGSECGPACYLLKTDRVCAGLGLGFCTHFCLMKVNNFRDSALEQFKDSWLLQ